MAKFQHCATEEVLLPAAQAGGIDEVLITQLAEQDEYLLSVRLLRTQKQIYLATRRNQKEPRTFKSADAAIGVAQKLFGVKQLTVILG